MRIPPQSSLLLRYFQQKCSSSKLRFSPQSSQLSWGRFHRSQSERGCLQWKPLTETNKYKKTWKTTLYEENNVVRLVDRVFLHKGLEVPPPDGEEELKPRLKRTIWEGLTCSLPPQWTCSHWTRCLGPSSCCTRTALSLALDSWMISKPYGYNVT